MRRETRERDLREEEGEEKERGNGERRGGFATKAARGGYSSGAGYSSAPRIRTQGLLLPWLCAPAGLALPLVSALQLVLR